MDKYIVAPPNGSTQNSVGAVDRPWKEGRFEKLPGINEYLAESTGYGIVSGCEPSISGLTVTVGAGIVHLADGTRKEIASTNITLDDADSTNPRIDLVYITSAGEVAKVTGTAAASPVVPSVPANGISVAQVSVAANASTGTVVDGRDMLKRWQNTGIVNVKDFGAVGDGVTDDTSAIQAAIDSGHNIYFPSGRYNITDTLTPLAYQSILSHGATIYVASPSIDGISVINNGVSLSNIHITGTGVSHTGKGINISGVNPCRLNNVKIDYFNIGINAENSNMLYLIDVIAINNNTDGVIINRIVDCFLQNLNASSNSDTGLKLVGKTNGIYANTLYLNSNGTNLYIDSNETGTPGEIFISELIDDNATTNGTYIVNGNDISLVNSWFSNRGSGKNLYVSQNANAVRISDSYIFNCTKNGIEINGVNCGVSNTTIQDASNGDDNSYDCVYIGATAQNTILSGVRCIKNINNPRYGLNIDVSAQNTRIDADCYIPTLGTIGTFADGVYAPGNNLITKVSADLVVGGASAATTVSSNGITSTAHVIQSRINGEDYGILALRRNDLVSAVFFGANGGDGNPTASTIMRIRQSSVTSRSISAGGTVNTSGSDYAEYMYKKDNTFTVNPGDVIGVNKDGKLTNRFDESITFVVKSTKPSFVGGDVWKTEKERKMVDRIAFCGQVPVNIDADKCNVGDFILPDNDNNIIKAKAVNGNNISFEDYRKAVGRVLSIKDNIVTIVAKIL